MNNLLRRTFMTIFLVSVVSVVVYIFPPWLFCLVIVFFVVSGEFELFRLIENKKIFVYKYFGTITGGLIPIVVYMSGIFPGIENLEPFAILIASLFAFTLQFIRKDLAKDHLVSIAVTLFAIFYVGWLFSFFLKIRLLSNGANLVAFLILVTKGTDIGAYLIGSKFGRTELIPRISPKKTKEGTIGGIIFSLVLSVTLGKALTGFAPIHLVLLGVGLATLGQIGDLAESLIKRDCGVKDSGTMLPSIGGMLDLIDSLLFTAPVFYYYIKTF